MVRTYNQGNHTMGSVPLVNCMELQLRYRVVIVVG